MELPQLDDYRSLFLNNTPLLDVRAPVEFNQGAFPFTQNFPLINNQERTDIGIRYKNKGQDEAIKLGHELVQGEIKAERVDHWANYSIYARIHSFHDNTPSFNLNETA